MSLRSLLLKMAFRFERNLNPVTAPDVSKQLEYVNHFSNPKDDIERSYYQYRCVMKLYGKMSWIILNIASAPLTWYYLLMIKKVSKDKYSKKHTAVFLRDGKPENILPVDLREKYEGIESEPSTENELSKEDKKYIHMPKKIN